MKKRLSLLFFLTILFAIAGFTTEIRAQSITGSIANGTVARGKEVRATVMLNIPAGLHVNSARPDSEFSVPTTVRASSRGVKIGAVTYPRGKNRRFSFSENTINVYEGRVPFNFSVTVPANFSGSSVSIRVAVKYQACTEEVCYRPATKQLVLTAKVK